MANDDRQTANTLARGFDSGKKRSANVPGQPLLG